jgi:protocatechuate 3,4-dioxygenase beta subunit
MKHSIISRLALAAISLFLSFPVFSQTKVTVTGTVTDRTGQPVIGAGVFERNI